MLTYKFLYEINGEYVYEYYVEGKTEFVGKVAIKTRKEGRILELAPDDEFKTYAFHAIYGIDAPKEKEGTLAWY